MNATLLADGWHSGPGPWIVLIPLFWIGVVFFLRRVVFRGAMRRGGRGPWGPWAPNGPQAGPRATGQGPAPSPIETLNRRYADGEIDEFEYRERYDLLTSVINPATGTADPQDGKR